MNRWTLDGSSRCDRNWCSVSLLSTRFSLLLWTAPSLFVSLSLSLSHPRTHFHPRFVGWFQNYRTLLHRIRSPGPPAMIGGEFCRSPGFSFSLLRDWLKLTRACSILTRFSHWLAGFYFQRPLSLCRLILFEVLSLFWKFSSQTTLILRDTIFFFFFLFSTSTAFNHCSLPFLRRHT